MRKTSIALLIFAFLLVDCSMAEEIQKSGDGEAAVHIVYVDRPEGEEAEAFHIKVLSSVVGSEEAAKEAVVYHYTHAASGFSAKLTPKQVADLSEKPEVLQVQASKTYQLHGQGASVGGGRPSVL